MRETRDGVRGGQLEKPTTTPGINAIGPFRSYALPQGGVLTDEEWAEVLDCDAQVFRDWVYRNGIPFIPFNRGIIVEAEDFYRFGKVVVVHGEETSERRRVNLPIGNGLGGDAQRASVGRKSKTTDPPRPESRRRKGPTRGDAK